MADPALAAIVAVAQYKPGWRFRLEHGPTGSAGSCWAEPGSVTTGGLAVQWDMTGWWPSRLLVCLMTRDSLPPHGTVLVQHEFTVPDEPGMPWHRWLLECIHRVEIHEMCEAFAVGGCRPFFPEHGPDAGPAMYEITDRGLTADDPPR